MADVSPTVRATDEARARDVLRMALPARYRDLLEYGYASDVSLMFSDAVRVVAATFARDASTDAGVREAADFLCARLRDYEHSEEAGREFYGHVLPALARCEAAFATPAPLADAGKPIDAPAVPTREVPTSVDDAETVAFIDGWNARLDHTDFDMALHYWNLSQCTHIGEPIPRPAEQPGQPERIEAIWQQACAGREGYCSSDLQDAAREAIRMAFREAERLARGVTLPAHYQWSEGNVEKFEFGRDTAADAILAQPGAGGEGGLLRVALQRIADADDVTLMCDPLGSKRIARAALEPRP